LGVGLDGEGAVAHFVLLRARHLDLLAHLVRFLDEYSAALEVLRRLVVDFDCGAKKRKSEKRRAKNED
jgi:hypothetical protein